MKPDRVRECMRGSCALCIVGADKVLDGLEPINMKHLIAAYKEIGNDEAFKEKIDSVYRMLKSPGDIIMNGEDVKDGIASLCIGLVVFGRSRGIELSLEEVRDEC